MPRLVNQTDTPRRTPRHTPQLPSERARVLTAAVAETTRRLGLRPTELHAILGVSQASVSRLLANQFLLSDGSKPFELAALLVRIYRSLVALVGGDELARAWLRAPNAAFDGRAPLTDLRRVDGMVHVSEYLDAHRARV